MSYTREPMIQSCDTGQQVPYFDSCLLINVYVQYQVKHRWCVRPYWTPS